MSWSLESNIFSLEEKANLINKSYKGNTDLIWKWVDKLVGIFWGETVEKIYFNNPKVPREDFVGVIRTSYSIEDMLSRLRKKYIHLLPDTPYTNLLNIL